MPRLGLCGVVTGTVPCQPTHPLVTTLKHLGFFFTALCSLGHFPCGIFIFIMTQWMRQNLTDRCFFARRELRKERGPWLRQCCGWLSFEHQIPAFGGGGFRLHIWGAVAAPFLSLVLAPGNKVREELLSILILIAPFLIMMFLQQF